MNEAEIAVLKSDVARLKKDHDDLELRVFENNATTTGIKASLGWVVGAAAGVGTVFGVVLKWLMDLAT